MDHLIYLVSHLAIVIGSTTGRLLTDLFLRFGVVQYPAKAFEDERDALDWLRQLEARRSMLR